MLRFVQYYGRFNDVRGQFGGLPGWAKWPVAVAAIPGLVLALLSILAFIVSILALLLLTVPVYRLMTLIAGQGGRNVETTVVSQPPNERRAVDVKVIE